MVDAHHARRRRLGGGGDERVPDRAELRAREREAPGPSVAQVRGVGEGRARAALVGPAREEEAPVAEAAPRQLGRAADREREAAEEARRRERGVGVGDALQLREEGRALALQVLEAVVAAERERGRRAVGRQLRALGRAPGDGGVATERAQHGVGRRARGREADDGHGALLERAAERVHEEALRLLAIEGRRAQRGLRRRVHDPSAGVPTYSVQTPKVSGITSSTSRPALRISSAKVSGGGKAAMDCCR